MTIQELKNELERERMRLAACGVAAMCNTPESAAEQRIGSDSPYYSASYADVCKAVDREMELRAALDGEVREFIGWLSGDIPELHSVEVPRLADSWAKFRLARHTSTNESC